MRPKNSVPQFRIEAGGSRISPNDLKPWGELRGHVAWSILCFAETGCKDREAKLKLLEASADDIIDIVRKSRALPSRVAFTAEGASGGIMKRSDAPLTPKRGMYFDHSAYLDPDMGKKVPLVCKIMRIAQGTIYYRPYYGVHEDGSIWLGSVAHFPIESFDKHGSHLRSTTTKTTEKEEPGND